MGNAFSSVMPRKQSWGPGLTDDWARRIVLQKLRSLSAGRLTIVDDREVIVQGCKAADAVEGRINVLSSRFYRSVLTGGSVGAAESYIRGEWESDDLTELVRVLVLNRETLDHLDRGWAWLTTPLRRLFHQRRKNTTSGSRQNIASHYDLGNDFYELFLDPTLMYSCAVFDSDSDSLEKASEAKNERICRKLQLSPDDHLLEIGTGWGGFALHAASRYGCRLTTTTISQQQYECTVQRVKEAGLEHLITVLLEDYRELTGRFDKLVSIEMIEAVGSHYFDTYFRRCSELLKPDGQMLLQAITIPDHLYQRARSSVDFIKRYIFPGSCLPSIASISQSLASVTDLRVFHLEDLTPFYALTLRAWRDRFTSNLSEVRRLGFSENFVRMWEFYLCYCEGGFAERGIGSAQLLLTKPLCRRDPLTPPLEGGVQTGSGRLS